MLPLGAFQRRAGGGMRLHGGSDMGNYDPYAGQEGSWQGGGDSGGYWVPAPEPAPAPAPSGGGGGGEPAPSGGGGGGYVVSDPGYAPAAPAAPDWTQTVNDIYIQTFGRQADASGLATFTNLLNQGWTGEQVRGALTSSAEYQQQQAAQAPAPAPAAPPPAAPAGGGSSATVNALYQQYLGRNADDSGMATFTNLLNQGWTPAQVANAITSSSEYQQRNPGATPVSATPVAPGQLATPQYRVVEQVTGSGGDGGYNVGYYLADQDGNYIQSLKAMSDDSGNFTGYGITSSSGGGDNVTDYVNPLNLDQLNAQAAQLAAAPPVFGAGEGKALGRPYAVVRNDGLPYKEYDAQGNLTRWRDKDWNWHSAAEVPVSGTEVRADGTIVPTYDLGGRIVMAPNVYEGGGVFQGFNWKMAASIVLMAVMAVAGPAIMTALAAEGAAAAGGALAATEGGFIAADAAATIAGAGAFDTAAALGMTLDQAITTGLMTEIGTLTDIGAAAIMEGAGIAPEMAASFINGTIPAETIGTAATEVTNAYNTAAPALTSTNPTDVFNVLVDQMTINGNLPITPLPGSESAALSGAGTATDIAAGGALQNIPAVPGAVANTPAATTSFLSQAAKSAAINAGMTALQGGSPQDILKAAAAGVAGAGIGIGFNEVMGNSLLSQIAGRAAASAGAAVVAGADPMKAALQGAAFATVAGLLPDTLNKIDAYKDLSANTKEYIINSLSNGISQAAAGTGTLTQGMLTGAIGTYVDKLSTDFFAKGINLDPNTFVDDIKNTVKKFWTSEGSNIIESGPMAGYEIGKPIPGSETAQAGTSDQIPNIPGRNVDISGPVKYDYDKLFDAYQEINPNATYSGDEFASWVRTTDPNTLYAISSRATMLMPEGYRYATPDEIDLGLAEQRDLYSQPGGMLGFTQRNANIIPLAPGEIVSPGSAVFPPGADVRPITPTPTPTVPGTTPAPTVPTPLPPGNIVDNGNGTSTQTGDDGSTITTNNQTGQVIISTPAIPGIGNQPVAPGTTPGITTTPTQPGTGTTPGTGGGGTGGEGTGPGGGGVGGGGVGGGTFPTYPIITTPPVPPVTRPDPGTFVPGAPYPLAPLAQGGMNPGYLMGGAVQPYYQTTDPTQAQYYWGGHPYIPTLEQIGLWNQPVGAPSVPFGAATGPRTAFNTNINTLLPVAPTVP